MTLCMLATTETAPQGLATAEAARRLREYGPNAMPQTTAPLWRSALAKFWAPVPWMLEAVILLQLVLGEYVEAAVIAALLVFNAGLGFFQESRSQATLSALKHRLALRASVLRDGNWLVVPAEGLVPGDVVKLTLGGVVPADVKLLDGNVLLDQSTLTGESLPVEAGAGFQTYAGALVRRGEATAEVTGTGIRTVFGRTAELVRTASVVSSQQKAVFRVVRNLALFNGCLVVVQLGYALSLRMPLVDLIPLVLIALLASVPVALPATFTLATALGARALARCGVLPTRLSAIDEAATMNVLCADKTGTITENALRIATVEGFGGYDVAHVLGFAALASSEGGADPVDTAIRNAAAGCAVDNLPRAVKFVPFDPAKKLSEALALNGKIETIRIVKGAVPVVVALAKPAAPAAEAAARLEGQGFRVLAVAVGPKDLLEIVGLVALSDFPRSDAAALLSELRAGGIRPVMVTGDTPQTAATIAHAVGLDGAVCSGHDIPDLVQPEDYAIYAGVLPEDKYALVKAFQRAGHVVGMCGDGANDAPALRQAQIGIAVSTATDVAKSAAGIVLTEPGLEGVVTAVREGRITFQRILTYTLRSITRKIDQGLFLTAGLILTGHAILTPLLMVLLMTSGDFLAMSSTTDNVRPSAEPNDWQIGRLTIAGMVLGTCNLVFCTSTLAIGKFALGLGMDELRTLAAITLVFSGQAIFYVVRERRRLWSSRPSTWFFAASIADVGIISVLALRGILMHDLPLAVVACVGVAAVVFAFALDFVKVGAFRILFPPRKAVGIDGTPAMD